MTYILTKVYESRQGINCEFTPSDCIESGEGKTTLLFRASDWYDAKLHEGDAVTDEQYEVFYEKSCLCTAIAKAEKMLATSDYSRSKLVFRLTRYDIEKHHAEAAANLMVEKGYINEEEQSKRIARYFCLKKYYGKKRIAAELMGRGYERKAIFEAIDSVTAEEYSYALRRLISQKFKTPPADRREQDNRIAALSRMGFSISEIMTALKENKADY
jgi:SOS response regulatory protein OraA/RecX